MNPGVYILQSLRNLRYYIGSTGDIENRLKDHNQGKVKATMHLRPWVVKGFVPCETMTLEKQSELRLKSYKSRKIVEKVIADLIFPWDYKRP